MIDRATRNHRTVNDRARHALRVCLALFCALASPAVPAQDTAAIPGTVLLEQVERMEAELDSTGVTQANLSSLRAQAENLLATAKTCIEEVQPELDRVEQLLGVLSDLGPDTDASLFDRYVELTDEKTTAQGRLLDCEEVDQRAGELLTSISQRAEELNSQYLWQRDASLATLLRSAPATMRTWPETVQSRMTPALRANLNTLQLLWLLAAGGSLAIVSGVLIRFRYLRWYRNAGHDTAEPQLALLLPRPFAKHAPILLLGTVLLGILGFCTVNASLDIPVVRVAAALLAYGVACVVIDWTTGKLSPAARVAGFHPDHVNPLRFRLRILAIVVIASFVILGADWFHANQEAPAEPLIRFLTLVLVSLGLGWTLTYLGRIRGLKRYRLFIGIGLFVLFAALATGALGFLNFATYLTQGAVRTTAAAIVVWLVLWLVAVAFESAVEGRGFLGQRVRGLVSTSEDSRTSFGVIQLTTDVAIWLTFVIYLVYVWDSSGVRLGELQSSLSGGFTLFSVSIVPAGILRGLIVFGIMLALVSWLKRLIDKRWLRHMNMDRGARDAMVTLTGYIGFVIAVVIALSAADIDLAGLALIGGGLALGIGFGLQAIASNFVSGLILLFERPIKAGDFVTVGEVEGFVRRIRIRATDIETLDNQNVLVPNSELVSGRVTNWVLRNPQGRLRIRVGVAYGSDTELVRKLMEQVGREHEDVISDGRAPAPRALFMGFGDSSLDFELRVRIRRIEKRFSVISDINFEIDRVFRENGIEIPFPQRDVHLVSLPDSSASATPEPATTEEPQTRPRRRMSSPVDDVTRAIKRELKVAVSIERVWTALTDAEQLRRWYAREIDVAARIGGRLDAVLPDESVVDAVIDVFMPPRRLRWASLTPDGEGPLPSGPVYEALTLAQDGDAVILTVNVTGIPADEDWEGYYRRKEAHWEQSLVELAKLLADKKNA